MTADNKQIITHAMTALAAGDSTPFYEAMADDCVWRPMCEGPWSRVHHGREQARDELFAPLRRQYAGPYTNTATHIFADGDTVIVEAKGAVALKSGGAYNNRYCFVIEMSGGKMKEVREYLDSGLANTVLEPLPPP
jgi:ketosteroid isomerase-like protein